MIKQNRPKFINLMFLGPRMPINAKVSILHRISGVLLFLSIPVALHLLHSSLTNAAFYGLCECMFSGIIGKLCLMALLFAFIYHLCAGVRFLFLDMHKFINRKASQDSAKVVIVVSILLTIALGVFVW